MKSKIFFRIFPYIIIAVLLIMFGIDRTNKPEPTIITKIDSVYTPIKIDSVITKFDTIYKPVPKVVYKTNPVNQELLDNFKKASDKLKLYEEAIKENEYVEVFEDTLQKVTVHSTTQGKLLKQSVNTQLKPRTIDHYTTTITKTIVKHDESKLFLGVQAKVPTFREGPIEFGPTLMYKTPKQNIWSVGVTNTGVTIGYSIKLW